MTDSFDLTAYQEELRLKVAHMTGDQLAEVLMGNIDSAINFADSNTNYKAGEFNEMKGVLIEAARRLARP